MSICISCNRPLYAVCMRDPCESRKQLDASSTEKWRTERPKPRCAVDGCNGLAEHKPEGVAGMLCEEHRDEWLRGERDLLAEREEMSGREKVVTGYAPLFGLARAFDTRTKRSA
jgi:hypothetical protein